MRQIQLALSRPLVRISALRGDDVHQPVIHVRVAPRHWDIKACGYHDIDGGFRTFGDSISVTDNIVLRSRCCFICNGWSVNAVSSKPVTSRFTESLNHGMGTGLAASRTFALSASTTTFRTIITEIQCHARIAVTL